MPEPVVSILIKTQYDRFDISHEEWREYVFPDGGVTRIESPSYLFLRKDIDNALSRFAGGDSHRLIAANGMGYYIPRGWVGLRWQAKEDHPLIAF